MAKRLHQQKSKRQVCQQNDDAVFYRRTGIAAGKKVWGEGFDHNVYGQPDGVGNNGAGCDGRFESSEFAVLEKDVDNRSGQYNQSDCGGDGQEGAVFNGFVLDVAGLVGFSGFEVMGQNRQDGHADGGSDDAERQLLQPVGIVKPRDGAGSDH